MKMKIVVLSIAFLTVSLFASAQKDFKFGHINTQELLTSMPQSDSAKMKIEKLTKELEGQLEQMQVELNKKYEGYLQNRESLAQAIRQAKETELQDMNQRIQTFQQNAEQDLQKQKVDLFKPIYDKMNSAIDKVAKANNFTYIFDISLGAVLYHSEQSQDITPLVKKELAIVN